MKTQLTKLKRGNRKSMNNFSETAKFEQENGYTPKVR